MNTSDQVAINVLRLTIEWLLPLAQAEADGLAVMAKDHDDYAAQATAAAQRVQFARTILEASK